MPTQTKQIIVFHQSGSEDLNEKAFNTLSKLEEKGVEVRVAPWCPMLEKYFHFPAIEVGAEDPENSFKKSGIESIERYVEQKLTKLD